jgi:hypothetical protein
VDCRDLLDGHGLGHHQLKATPWPTFCSLQISSIPAA